VADAERPKLTDRQAAVLAAVERLGRPVMADLWSQFPDLAPSVIKKVLDALGTKGLVDHAGDHSQAFVNGVHWWSTALTPTEYADELALIVGALDEAKVGLRHEAARTTTASPSSSRWSSSSRISAACPATRWTGCAAASRASTLQASSSASR